MRILKQEYDRDNFISVTTVYHRGKVYAGTSIAHPDDRDIASMFIGMQFSAYQAMNNALKGELKDIKSEIMTLNNLFVGLTQLREYDPKHRMSRHIRKTLYILDERKRNLERLIKEREESYPQMVENRLSVARNIKNINVYH